MLALVIGGNVGGLGGPLEPLNYIHFMCTNYVPGEPEVGVGFGVQLYGLPVVVNVAGILFFYSTRIHILGISVQNLSSQ